MSADVLRRAASLMRARAEAATPGPWHPATTGVEGGDHWSVIDYPTMNPVARIPSQDGENEDQREPDARHIAAADPPFMLTVADWLDHVAYCLEFGSIGPTDERHALAVARAYLGGAS